MKAILIRDMDKLIRLRKGKLKVLPKGNPKGTVIDNPRAYLLVKQGVASPMDKECADAAGMSPEQFKVATAAYEKVASGISIEDYEAHKRGLMIGYKPDGKDGDTWIHGPNWNEGCEADYYSNEEEDDDGE